ncbi:DUF3300 domain-containing protein [Pseudogulbenkiania subflava]|uniref:DUF3300 domain-containing protein n=1 Tax=Pseudogulbenkiania subflava DSM 22618 TaxID=1123014 RepID=A0A1Y6BR47_9NEIS|nr:DUF3300 domain-containing protein [Pseudogulbenkiania subflava]SMF22737.1 Protein of unknown function [Pseudogulbenkiania subflava DSM 22618]
MPQRIRRFMTQCLVLVFAAAMGLATAPTAVAQDAEYTQAELDQMLAPIALYPDSLLSQVLMASTYPLEVVEAARWSRNHPKLKGDEAVRAANRQDWDPSVVSLVAFPQVLQMMDDHLEWTQELGDAFLAQEDQVMDTVQRLRDKAWDQGYLRSNRYVRVASREPVIVLEPVDPLVVYVPYYDPLVVYGPWWWPDYPPYYWTWPGYYVGPSVGIYWGVGFTLSVGFFFGNFDWPHHHVTIVNINNFYVQPRIVQREWIGRKGPFRWEHDPEHRGNVPYHGFIPRDIERTTPAKRLPPLLTQPGLENKPLPSIINPARRPEIERRHDQRPDWSRGGQEQRGKGFSPPGRLGNQGERKIDIPRTPRPQEQPFMIRPEQGRPQQPDIGNAERRGGDNRRFERRQQDINTPRAPRPQEMPTIIRPEQARPNQPDRGNAERQGGDNRRFERRQPGAETPRVPRSTEMPTIIRPEPPRPRQPDVGVPERRREAPQIERRQFERPNPAPSARPSFAPRSEEPRRGGQVPPRQIINQGNPGGGQDH